MPETTFGSNHSLCTIDKRGAKPVPGPLAGLELLVAAAELEDQLLAFRHWLRHNFAQRNVTMIPIMKGGNVFFGDVFLNPRAEFASLTWSYVTAQSGGAAKRVEDVKVDTQYLKHSDVENRHCIVLDDVFDSGFTAEAVMAAIVAKGTPASLSFFTVVEKHRPRTCAVRPTKSLFLIDDVWVCGYGLDGGNEHYRHLRVICKVQKPERKLM